MNGFIRLQQVWERHVLQTPAATNISNWLPAEVCRPRWSESRPPFLAGPSQEPMVVSLAHYEWNLGKDLDAFGALSPGLGMAYQPLDEQCRWPNWETSKTSFFSVSLKKAIWGPRSFETFVPGGDGDWQEFQERDGLLGEEAACSKESLVG